MEFSVNPIGVRSLDKILKSSSLPPAKLMHGGSWIVKNMVHRVFHYDTLACYEHILFKQQVPRDGAKEGPVGPTTLLKQDF